ncbi:MAG: NAD-dependent deacylase [Flavobacteriales bacterium]|nr:NAD-dependent deacylase [Flavobacteriales bacterium]
MAKKRLVVLSGAGMSAESGIPTFRGSDGLWEGHKVEDVASPEAWQRDPLLVLDFYNQRRKNILNAQPNQGHKILAELEAVFEVVIITQNIDDLHERAGSSNVLHLHGEILKARSTGPSQEVYLLNNWEMKWGDQCREGYQLRPHIVWFGEAVPMISPAAELCSTADLLVVVGTSMAVYPAASLIHYAPLDIPKYIVDPHIPSVAGVPNLHPIALGAGEGLKELRTRITAG